MGWHLDAQICIFLLTKIYVKLELHLGKVGYYDFVAEGVIKPACGWSTSSRVSFKGRKLCQTQTRYGPPA